MNIEKYKSLIQNLPVREQSSTTKINTWKSAEDEFSWLKELNTSIFKNEESLKISRQDVFEEDSTKGKIIKTIYWGYSSGMRGNHFKELLKDDNILELESIFNGLKGKHAATETDFNSLTEKIKGIKGIHLSTYSKLLYFFEIKFNNNPCLILDLKVIEAIKNFNEFSALKKIKYETAESLYLQFLEISNNLALKLETYGENIEEFLFIFGNSLKNELTF